MKDVGDLEAIKEIASIKGDLVIRNTEISEVDLPRLVRIEGTLSVSENGRLKSVSMPSLVGVKRYLSVYKNPRLRLVDVPSLRRVGQFQLFDCKELRKLAARRLVRVDATVSISNSWLRELDLSSLSVVGTDIKITDNDYLTKLDIDSLTDLGGRLDINDNKKLCDSIVNALLSRLRKAGYEGYDSYVGPNKEGC